MVTLGFACKTYITCMIQQVCMYACVYMQVVCTCACTYVCVVCPRICTRPHYIMNWPVFVLCNDFTFSIIRKKYKESIRFTMN